MDCEWCGYYNNLEFAESNEGHSCELFVTKKICIYLLIWWNDAKRR